jgi:hypothetical protein
LECFFGLQGIIKKLLCNHNTKKNTKVQPFLYKNQLQNAKKSLSLELDLKNERKLFEVFGSTCIDKERFPEFLPSKGLQQILLPLPQQEEEDEFTRATEFCSYQDMSERERERESMVVESAQWVVCRRWRQSLVAPMSLMHEENGLHSPRLVNLYVTVKKPGSCNHETLHQKFSTREQNTRSGRKTQKTDKTDTEGERKRDF